MIKKTTGRLLLQKTEYEKTFEDFNQQILPQDLAHAPISSIRTINLSLLISKSNIVSKRLLFSFC